MINIFNQFGTMYTVSIQIVSIILPKAQTGEYTYNFLIRSNFYLHALTLKSQYSRINYNTKIKPLGYISHISTIFCVLSGSLTPKAQLTKLKGIRIIQKVNGVRIFMLSTG